MKGIAHTLARAMGIGFLVASGPRAGAQLPYFQDTFAGTNDVGWTHYDPFASSGAPGSFTVTNGEYRLQASASPDPTALGPGHAASLAGPTMSRGQGVELFVSVNLTGWDSSQNQTFGCLALVRNLGSATSQGYAFGYSTSGSIGIFRLQNDSLSPLVSAPIALDPTHAYLLEVTLYPDGLVGQVFRAEDPGNEIAGVVALDTNPGSGVGGLFVWANTGAGLPDATFDNFRTFQAIPEPSAVMLMLTGGGLAWALRARWRRRSPPAKLSSTESDKQPTT